MKISPRLLKSSVDGGIAPAMNYLAHLYFSAPRPLAWTGSLMGDFFKGNNFDGLPDDLVFHLKLHRRLDTFTLSSPPFQSSRRRLDPGFGHGRSILVDVFYDHLLACRWDTYAEVPLPDFAREVYSGLHVCYHYLPARLQEQLPRMTAADWLSSYRHEDVVERVLQRLEQRLRHKIPLASGYQQLSRHRAGLEEDFTAFMADIRAYVQVLCADATSLAGDRMAGP
ncbi:MAG: ACP phosphodiesterase [Pelovirga sp.]